jgi:hypothetical protein
MDERRRKLLIELLEKAIDPTTSDVELGEVLSQIDAYVPHPAVVDLIFHHEPELSVEEILEVALSYKPIILGKPDDK